MSTPETLVLKEQFSLSGDDFDIRLQSGIPIFKVDGKVASLSRRKSLFDLRSGRHLFDIQKEHLHIHSTFALNSPEGRKLGEVKGGFASMCPSSAVLVGGAFAYRCKLTLGYQQFSAPKRPLQFTRRTVRRRLFA